MAQGLPDSQPLIRLSFDFYEAFLCTIIQCLSPHSSIFIPSTTINFNQLHLLSTWFRMVFISLIPFIKAYDIWSSKNPAVSTWDLDQGICSDTLALVFHLHLSFLLCFGLETDGWPRCNKNKKSTNVQTSPWLALRQSSGQGLEFGPYYGRLTPLFHGMVDSDMNPATLFM